MLTRNSLPPGWTEADRDALTEGARRTLLHRAPRNDEELYRYFGIVHGFWIARKACCPEHASPFEFLADAYWQRHLRQLAMAAKSSGKTQALALLHVANSRFKPGCWTAHMGGSEKQANRCYDYIRTELARPDLAAEIEGHPLRSITTWKSKGEMPGSRVEVLTATVGQASGPHPQIATADEFDQFPWDVWEHFNKTPHEAHGVKAQIIMASTRFKLYGPMTRIIETLGSHLKVSPWCTWDVMKRCDFDCKNLPPAAGAFAGQQCPLYARKVPDPVGGGFHEEPMCAGKAHSASGHLSWDEVVNAVLVSNQESFRVLQTLGEPGKEGLFFPECDQAIHRGDFRYVPGRPVYLGYDYGFGFPMCLGAWQMRQDGFLYQFDEVYGMRLSTQALCGQLAEKPWLKDVEVGWPDPSAQEAIETFRAFFQAAIGRPVMVPDTDNARIPGWAVLRRRLRGPLGEVGVGWDRAACPSTWSDVAGLQRKEGTEDCEKKEDHGADQSRYLVRNLEAYLGLKEAWSEERRPEGGDAPRQRALDAQAEQLIRERWDRLRGQGVTEERLKTSEARFDGDRRQFADMLGEWLSERTLGGRMRRGGLTERDDQRRPDYERPR